MHPAIAPRSFEHLLQLILLFGLSAAQAEDLSWSGDSGPASRFLAVHGRRSATFGYSENGLESWAYPVQILTSFGVSFRRPQAIDPIDGQTLLRRIVYSPEAVTRIYVGPDFVVREKIFVPLEQAGTLISYEVQGQNPVDIVVHFTPVLDLMWPASLGGQDISWDASHCGYVLSEGSHRYTAMIASPQIVAHDEVHNANRRSGPGLAFVLRPDGQRQAHIVISGGAAALSDSAALERNARDHYQKLMDQALQIETPDGQVNRALAWSEIAVDQAWVCNPDFGCGQVGGYGASRRGRRPQYDWFFAGDGLVSTAALLASGQYPAARDELEFILRYQDRKSGMIWHELSQSAASLNWQDYPYMYVHVGLTADFLVSAAAYYRASGDAGFVEKHWAALQLAWRYSRSLLDSGGLPEIPADKQGANEQDALGDELSLSAGWVGAAEAFADLAGATGHHALEKDARSAARLARDAIAKRYWDEQQHYWISGHTRSGAATRNRESRPSTTVLQGLFSADQRASGLNQLAAADFQTDWGTRGRPSTDARYDPNAYASGSVWAIGSAEAASAFWAEHRPLTALPIWQALVPWSTLDSLGHMHETLAGDLYHEEIESVPEQTWSSASFFTATVRGLLGLKVDGVARRVVFAPHLPANWGSVVVRHVHVANSELTLKMTQSVSEIELQVENRGTPVTLEFNPQLPLGATGTQVQQNQQDTHARVEFAIPAGASTHTIRFSGGVAIIVPVPQPQSGEPSRGMKLTGATLRDRVLTLELDRVSESAADFELRTPWKIAEATGAGFTSDGHFTVKGPPGHHRVTVNFGS
jgi:glycogen debranching enzyme